jgi:hypothetical protein
MIQDQTTTKDYCVMSQKLAGILLAKGFKLNKIAPNRKYPNKHVFYFFYTNEIINVVKEYIKER